MNENENMVNVETVETDATCNEVTEKEKPDLGGYAILGLAGVGTAFLLKKAFDLGKKAYGKAKEKVAAVKAAKAEKKAEEPVETKEETPAEE